MKALAYGYAHDITDVEASKPEALESLRVYIRKHHMNRVSDDGAWLGRLGPIPEGIEIDESKVIYTPYRHGGLHLQASYTFDYPEATA